MSEARTDRLAPSVSVQALIKHMSLYMNDHNLRTDFQDCVLTLASSEADEETLNAYYKLRRKADQWSPYKPGSNNHKHIDPKALDSLMILGTGRAAKPRAVVQCDECEREFSPRRTDAKLCSPRCRQRAARKAATVTDNEARANALPALL
jgi:hypothetical protein